MELIEDIGPILGVFAFLGFAVLALLIVLQGREVRRLRDWAGRAPERAEEALAASQAVAEESGETRPPARPSRLAALRERVAGMRERIADAFASGWGAVDRRSPIDLRWIAALLLVTVVTAGAVTSGFGLLGEDEGGGNGTAANGGGSSERPARVAVLNATQIDDPLAPAPAVPGLADLIATEVVEPAGFKVKEEGDSPAGFDESVLMFEEGAEDDARRLARRISQQLGETPLQEMTADVRRRARNAELALLVGRDHADFAAAAGL